MKTFLEEYGLIVVSAIIIMIMVVFATPMATALTEETVKTTQVMDKHLYTGMDENYGENLISYEAPPSPMTEDEFSVMLAEAEKHLGKAYVFGASGPDNFDCSGYVSWVINKAGVKDIERTTASGLTGHCTYVSATEAQPGDLIFFEDTYQFGISHVGIYIGEDSETGEKMMIHCGDPIQKESIETSYWQEHFTCFGRIS